MLLKGRQRQSGTRPYGRPVQINYDSPQYQYGQIRLVSWWPFTEGAGGTAQELVSGNHAQFSNAASPWRGSPIGGGGFSCEGGSAQASSATVRNIPTFNKWMLVSCWVRLRSIPNNVNASLVALETASGREWHFQMAQINSQYYIYTDSVVTATTTTTVPILHEWTHVALAVTGASGYSYYVNGRAVQTGSVSATSGTATVVRIGRRQRAAQGSIDGDIADVRIYAGSDTNVNAPRNLEWLMYDPATRWDLYWTPSTRVLFDLPASPTFKAAWARYSNTLIAGGVQ